MPKTSRRLTVHPLTLREVEVVRVVDLTQRKRRITLSGEQLCEFTSANGFPQSAFDSPGFDDDIRLVFRAGIAVSSPVQHPLTSRAQ
ncbi:SIP domain-containing protein [Streptomyces blattellae]|uniref:hypothetical protein n=1 Tax=Streptomyces blattellae TaxID=2569855 RepID=UPI001E5E5510|nr:hypothetical protein [Streptomyces blattellae]